MQPSIDVTRRAFLVRASQGSIALAVLSLAGCGPTELASASAGAPESADPGDTGGGGGGSSPTATRAAGATAVQWHRVNLGYVSAYVLARGGEAAVVDTGVAGSEGAIGDALAAAGLGWDAVGHVILTHRHQDHAGSAEAVLAATGDAAAFAGAADIPAIKTTRTVTAVADGETVFGLRIVATPGHTLGHIAVLDEAGGILVAGDALRTVGHTLAGSNPDFTDDVAQAKASIAKLGGLRYETLLVGHGEPVLKGAAAQVAALAAAG